MPYVYRCPPCAASSPPGPRRTVEGYRQTHRDTEHGGLVPDGERIDRVTAGAPHPDGRYVNTTAVLGGLALLALASAIARILGR